MPTAVFGRLSPRGGATAESLEPGCAIGEWRIERRVADGGMGSVYTAVHPVLEKRVAVKVLLESFAGDADATERFREEARILSRIAHRNLVDIYSFGELPDGRPYFVMEWLSGQTLADRLRPGPLPLAEAADVVDQLACALEAAHAWGVVHRDVKPDNVVLVPVDGRQLVKLVDFGVAKRVRARSTTGSILGTPEYFSPEQARGCEVSAASDVYSLGVVLFEVVLGRRPFRGENPMELARQHLNELPPRVRALWPAAPVGLDVLVDRMLRKDPAQRPSLAEIRLALTQLARAMPAPRKSRVRHRWLAAVAVSVIAAAAYGLVPRHQRPSPPPVDAEGGYCEGPPPATPVVVVKGPPLSDALIDPFSRPSSKPRHR